MTPQKLILELNKLGLTQVDITRHTGISQPTISRLANGKNTDPRASVIRALEALYQATRRSQEKA